MVGKISEVSGVLLYQSDVADLPSHCRNHYVLASLGRLI